MHVCYLCFSNNTEYIAKNPDFNTNTFACNACGLIQSEFVSHGYLKHYYNDKYRLARGERLTEKYLDFMSQRAASQHNYIKTNLPEDVKLEHVVDIGAGAGKLIECFIGDAKTYAVEADQMMINHLNKISDISVIDEASLFNENQAQKFDLVMLSHVFEHVNNPIEYLYQLHKILPRGGVVFLEVPNEPFKLIKHFLDQQKKGIGHLFNYRISTLKLMIEKSGLFEILDVTTFSISVEDYLSGKPISNFDENTNGTGIHIRCLLKKIDSTQEASIYSYIDAVLQSRYVAQYALEEKLEQIMKNVKSVEKTNNSS